MFDNKDIENAHGGVQLTLEQEFEFKRMKDEVIDRASPEQLREMLANAILLNYMQRNCFLAMMKEKL